jgi:hypothetical protein
MRLPLPFGLALVMLAGCATPAQQRTEQRNINKAAAKEINRVCALPADQRDAELKKLNDQSGVVVFCGDQ